MARKKIKLVTGIIQDATLLSSWEIVAESHDVEVFCLDSGTTGSQVNLPLVIFPNIEDMPGYYRDLETHLKGADLVVGFETSKLYSFQAMRASRNLGLPYLCLTHEYTPFVFENYANIRAIQYDIHQHADAFLCSSQRASQLLQIEGVADEKIQTFSMPIHSSQVGYSSTARNKFRNYVGLNDQHLVISIFAKLDEIDQALIAIQGIRLFLNRVAADVRDAIRIVICGSGQASSTLKYQVADMGLGPRTMFLAQDVSPFLNDLMCASDVLIDCKPVKSESSYLPWHLVRAAACGVRVMAVRGSIEDDWLPKNIGTRIESFSQLDIVTGLTLIARTLTVGEECRAHYAEQSKAAIQKNDIADVICNTVAKLCSKDERSTRRESLKHFIDQHQIPVTYKKAKDALVLCEEVKDFSATVDCTLHSEVLRIRGDALVALDRSDEAVSAFEAALKANSSNFHALRGLGYLAWQGYSHEDALSFFKRGLGVNPNDYQCLVGVGLVYRRLKMFDESVYWLKSAVAVGGIETPSLSLLVQACLENADEPKALEVLYSIKEGMGENSMLLTAIQKIESHQ